MALQVTIATFDNQIDVDKTIQDLLDAGIERSSIRVTSDDTSTALVDQDGKGFWESLGDLFMPDDEKTAYTTAQSDGHILMSVTVDEIQTEIAEDILQEFGTLDTIATDETGRSWGTEPLSSVPASGGMTSSLVDQGASALDLDTDRTLSRNVDHDQSDVLSVVEEDIEVGKREVSGGRMKVRSYVVETPFSQDVNLRTEHVEIVRSPVNRPVVDGELAFQDRVIEAEASSEQAVVSKTARVVEEISLKKTVAERSETIEDTVRSTRVDIEGEDGEIVDGTRGSDRR